MRMRTAATPAGRPGRGGVGLARQHRPLWGRAPVPDRGYQKAFVYPCLAPAVATLPHRFVNRLLKMRGQNFLKEKDLCCLKKRGVLNRD